MTSFFRGAFLVADQALDTAYAESITIQPMARAGGDSNARATVDGSRSAMTLQAIFDEPPSQEYPDAKGHASSTSHLVSATKPVVEFTTGLLPYRVEIGDLVLRGGIRFVVADSSDDGFGRTVLKLTART